MKQYFLLAAIVLIGVPAGIYFKVWQCQELFPNSSVVACVFWR